MRSIFQSEMLTTGELIALPLVVVSMTLHLKFPPEETIGGKKDKNHKD
jgi:hypothetical protein